MRLPPPHPSPSQDGPAGCSAGADSKTRAVLARSAAGRERPPLLAAPEKRPFAARAPSGKAVTRGLGHARSRLPLPCRLCLTWPPSTRGPRAALANHFLPARAGWSCEGGSGTLPPGLRPSRAPVAERERAAGDPPPLLQGGASFGLAGSSSGFPAERLPRPGGAWGRASRRPAKFKGCFAREANRLQEPEVKRPRCPHRPGLGSLRRARVPARLGA